MQYHENLRKCRLKSDLTQKAVAAEIGVSQQGYSAMERGVYAIDAEYGRKFAVLFNEKPEMFYAVSKQGKEAVKEDGEQVNWRECYFEERAKRLEVEERYRLFLEGLVKEGVYRMGLYMGGKGLAERLASNGVNGVKQKGSRLRKG